MILLNLLLPDYILKCIDILQNGGYEAYCVGGAVRDLIMGRVPNDYDLATNAPCRATADLFEKFYLTGEKHGTVTVIEDGHAVEITTYRSDGDYLDSRHPKSVQFVGDIETDLLRRDFTVNALAFHPTKGLVDITGGAADIENKILRAVGNPRRRFGEDALRIMRLFRFSGELGFKIEGDTLSGALFKKDLLSNISRERIYSELSRLLVSPDPTALNPLLKSGGLDFLGVNKCALDDKIKEIPPLLPLRTAVFCDMTEALPERLLKALKCDTKTLRKAEIFYELLGGAPKKYSDFKRIFEKLEFDEWKALAAALAAIHGENFKYITDYAEKIIKNNEPYKIQMLAINGDDVKKLGFKGKEIGKALENCLSLCLEKPSENKKDALIEYLLNH